MSPHKKSRLCCKSTPAWGLKAKSHSLLSKHLLQMPHTWGGSEAEPVAAMPPCLLPPFAAGVVLAVFVDVAMTAAFSGLEGAAIFLNEVFLRKSYGLIERALRSEILNVVIGNVPLSLCGSFQCDDSAWYGKKTKRSWRVWRRLTACCPKGCSRYSLLWLGRGEVMQSFHFNEDNLRPVMEGFPELQSAVTSVSVWMGGRPLDLLYLKLRKVY